MLYWCVYKFVKSSIRILMHYEWHCFEENFVIFFAYFFPIHLFYYLIWHIWRSGETFIKGGNLCKSTSKITVKFMNVYLFQGKRFFKLSIIFTTWDNLWWKLYTTNFFYYFYEIYLLLWNMHTLHRANSLLNLYYTIM